MTDADVTRLNAEWDRAFAALRAAGLEADADDPVAAHYRAASDAVNHANRHHEARNLRPIVVDTDDEPVYGWDHPEYSDWRSAVSNGDTLRGFHDWLASGPPGER